jgi:hypothetical protein
MHCKQAVVSKQCLRHFGNAACLIGTHREKQLELNQPMKNISKTYIYIYIYIYIGTNDRNEGSLSS